MSQPGGGPMAPGPPRPSLAPGPVPNMQPGLAPGMPGLAHMAPGQAPLTMAPGAMQPGPATSLPIQPLNMAPGVMSGPLGVNGGPRPLAPGPVPAPSLPISPLNMNPGPGQPVPPHMGMPGAQGLMMPGQPNSAFNPALAQPRPQMAVQGIKRAADGADDDNAAKRLRADEGNAMARPPSAGPPQPGMAPGVPGADLAAALMPAAAAAAAAAGRPATNPLAASNPLAAVMLQAQAQALAAQQAQAQAQAAARRRAAQAQAQAAEDADDAHKVLPRRGIRLAMRAAGLSDKDFVVDPATENALLDLYYDWLGSVVAMGCEAAKRRKSNVLKARDIAIHLERAWNLSVPGFNGDMLRPYRRPSASEVHRQRQVAVRRTAAELDKEQQQQHGGGGAAAGQGGAGAAAGAGAGTGQA